MREIATTLDFYIRIFLLIICLTVGLGFWVAGAKSALAASLKPVSIITESTLRVGDVFEGLSPEDANYILGPAPQPGEEMVLGARTLMRIALTMNLPWQPRHSGEQVVIRRSATVIDSGMIAEKLKENLGDKGVNGRYEVAFSGMSPRIILPESYAPDFEVSDLEFDHQKNWFRATLAAPSAEKPMDTVTVSGTVERLVSVPVVKNSIRAGDTITAADLDWIDLYSRDLQHDHLLKEEDVLGMTPRRMIEAGKPIRDRELIPPQIVNRGEYVTIVYENGPMYLTTKGRALENGAKGDVVRIVNTASNKSIEAFVTGERLVTIQ